MSKDGMGGKLDAILDEIQMANPGGELKAQEEATQSLKQLFLDMLGSDDITDGAFADINEKAEHFNELRAELRTKLEKL